MDLRFLKLKEKLENDIEFDQLKRCYEDLSAYFNRTKLKEHIQTNAEDKVFNLIKERTKILFYRSLWIGNRNIDLFCPSLTEIDQKNRKCFKGIAIEVDGDIHNYQFKMNQDNSKYSCLHRLGIALYTIENHDLEEASFVSFINKIKKLKRLDSRARKRVWRNIYFFTIYSHLDHFIVKNHLSEKQISILKEIGGLR